MAANAATGSFNITTQAATNTVAVTGLGFQPTALIFWWSGRTESTDASGGANFIHGVGFVASTTDRRCMCNFSTDAVGTTDVGMHQHETACITQIDAAGNIVGAADLSSFDSGGFTIVIDDDFTIDMRISFLALGGDINAAETGEFLITSAAGSGSQTVATTNTPECVIVIGSGHDTLGTQGRTNALASIGAATGTANEFVTMFLDRDARPTTITGQYGFGDEMLGITRFANESPDIRAEFTTFDSGPNGFTFNKLEGPDGDRSFYYLALSGGDYHVGDIVTATDTSNFSTTGVGFEPVAVLFVSPCIAESTQDAGTAELKLSIGAATSATERTAQALSSQDALATSEVFTAIEHDEVYIRPDLADGVEGLMDLVSMDSDGFTTVMDDADPAAAFVGFIAFGPAAAAVAAVSPGMYYHSYYRSIVTGVGH